MADRVNSLRVGDERVWRQIRNLFLGSTVLFLINIWFGFDNALTDGDLPRWQLLIHLHGGSIGWITLSVIALAVWLFSGKRELSEAYVGRVKLLVRVVLIAFGGYIISFGLAFSQQGGFFFLLPIFGISSALIIWGVTGFAINQLRSLEVKSAPQLMVTGGLLIASLGAVMGILLGLENALDTTIIPGADRIGAHAGVMDGYLLLAASAFVGWFLGRNETRYSRGALAQAIFFFLAPLVVWLGLIVDQEQLAGLSAPLILLGVIAFAVRNLRETFKLNPASGGPGGWIFFGAIWTVIWALIFVYLIIIFVTEGIEAVPDWLGVLFAHAAFVGMMTNLILSACSVRSYSARSTLAWAEPAGMWILNLGIIVFITLKYSSDSRLGAIIMGVGVLLSVGTMIIRLWSAAEDRPMAVAAAD